MNWKNYGSYWHIDHIIPQSVYQFVNLKTKKENLDEIQKCWSLRNLRPLEKIENIKKGNKLDYDLINQYKITNLLPNSLLDKN